MKKNDKKGEIMLPVSVVVPMRNSTTTVLITLRSILEQKYPVEKIIIVDNASLDDSVEKVQNFASKSRIPIQIVKNKENKGVGASYNLGVKKATSPIVVLMHSDSSIPTNKELEKLVKPLCNDENTVASYSYNILPQKVWETFNFWQKLQQARVVGKENPGMNGKFDSVKLKTFLKIGGFDEILFSGKYGFGGEDADLYFKLEKEGKVVLSDARVIHLHYLGGNYTLFDWIKNRKLRARTYGRLIRTRRGNLPLSTKGEGLFIPFGVLVFLVKPMLAITPFLPNLGGIGLLLLTLYAFLNSKKMYTSSSTLKNPRIILLPFIEIFMVYYETFWMIEAFIFVKKGYNRVII